MIWTIVWVALASCYLAGLAYLLVRGLVELRHRKFGPRRSVVWFTFLLLIAILWPLLLLEPLASWLRKWWKRFRFVIHINGDAYLVRYRLWKTAKKSYYLHHILRPDADRVLHTHPFGFRAIVLWGGYIEEMFPDNVPSPNRVFVRRGWLSSADRSAETAHRICELLHGPCWTLFIRGPRERDWGFWSDDGVWTRAIDENQPAIKETV